MLLWLCVGIGKVVYLQAGHCLAVFELGTHRDSHSSALLRAKADSGLPFTSLGKLAC